MDSGSPLDRPLPRRAVLKGLAFGALSVTASTIPLVGCAPKQYTDPGKLRVFSPKEHAVLDQASRVLLPEFPGLPSARDLDIAGRIDALFVEAHPALVHDVKQLLGAFEDMPWLSLRFQRFTEMSPAAQASYMDSWRTSRLPLKRQGYQGLKKLAQSVYYMDPRTWPQLGYEGPWLGRLDIGPVSNPNPNVLRPYEHA